MPHYASRDLQSQFDPEYDGIDLWRGSVPPERQIIAFYPYDAQENLLDVEHIATFGVDEWESLKGVPVPHGECVELESFTKRAE